MSQFYSMSWKIIELLRSKLKSFITILGRTRAFRIRKVGYRSVNIAIAITEQKHCYPFFQVNYEFRLGYGRNSNWQILRVWFWVPWAHGWQRNFERNFGSFKQALRRLFMEKDVNISKSITKFLRIPDSISALHIFHRKKSKW